MFLLSCLLIVSFIALTLMVGQYEEDPVCRISCFNNSRNLTVNTGNIGLINRLKVVVVMVVLVVRLAPNLEKSGKVGKVREIVFCL